ncbi:MAG: hypothetical protein B6U69_01510 [Thermofilum sp. ex4484_15]|nr:MAG: hypothetical protein B6U69_01510 [Thermofilum sp. ex4484_15]
MDGKELNKYYTRYVFELPRTGALLALILPLTISYGPIFKLTVVEQLRLHYTVLAYLLTLKVALRRALNLKRASAFYLLSTILALAILTIDKILLHVFNLPKLQSSYQAYLSWNLIISFITFLLIRAYGFRSIKASLPLYFVSLTSVITYGPVYVMLSSFLLTAVMVLVEYALKPVSVYNEGNLITKGLMDFFLLDDGRDLEEVFESLGITREVNVTLIGFKGDNEPTLLIAPEIHPGPLKGVGSSHMPYFLSKALEGKGYSVVLPLHTPCDHTLDLVSSKYLSHVINAIKTKDLMNKVPITEPIRVTVGGITLFSLRLGNALLVIVSRQDGGMEDIDRTIVEECRRRIGVKVIMIDGHNSYEPGCPSPTISNLMGKAIIEGVTKAWKRLRNAPNYDTLRVGSYHLRISYNNEIGKGGIWAIVLEIQKRKYFLLVLDANNMIKGLRNKLREELLAYGFADGEIITTDTHEVGVRPRRGYEPLGSYISYTELKNYLLEALRGASANLSSAITFLEEVKVNVRVLGREGLQRLYRLLQVMRERMRRSLIALLAISLALLY